MGLRDEIAELRAEVAALRANIGGNRGDRPWDGVIVNGPAGEITPSYDPKKCWVKPLAAIGTNDSSPVVLLRCRWIVPQIGLPVTVGTMHGGNEQEVLGVLADDLALMPGYTGQDFTTAGHADNHGWERSLTYPYSQPHKDAASLGVRNLTPLRVIPSVAGGLKVDIGSYGDYGGYVGLNLASHQPSSGDALFVTVYLDKDTNTAKSTAGSSIADNTAVNPPKATPSETNVIIAAYVRLDGDATTIADGDIDDPRLLFEDGRIATLPYRVAGATGTDKSAAQPDSHDDFLVSDQIQFRGGLVAGGDDGDSTTSEVTVYHDTATAYAAALPANADTALQLINTEDHVSGGVQTGVVFRLSGDTITRKAGIFAISRATGTREADLVFVIDDGTARPEVVRLTDAKAQFLTNVVVSPTAGDSALAPMSVHKDSSTAYANVVPNATTLPFYVKNTEDHASGGVYTGFMFNLTGDSENRIVFFGAITESDANQKTSFVICTDDDNTRTEKFRLTGDGDLHIGSAGAPGAALEIDLATEDLEIVDAGSTSATEQDWIEVQVGGNTGYIRVYATK